MRVDAPCPGIFLFPARDGAQAQHLLPGAWVEVPAASHYIPLDIPGGFVDIVQRFLRS